MDSPAEIRFAVRIEMFFQRWKLAYRSICDGGIARRGLLLTQFDQRLLDRIFGRVAPLPGDQLQRCTVRVDQRLQCRRVHQRRATPAKNSLFIPKVTGQGVISQQITIFPQPFLS